MIKRKIRFKKLTIKIKKFNFKHFYLFISMVFLFFIIDLINKGFSSEIILMDNLIQNFENSLVITGAIIMFFPFYVKKEMNKEEIESISKKVYKKEEEKRKMLEEIIETATIG
ncbi:hypothetical protein [Pontimicrobium sp. IMCC45349]|uniref:hypothetical protein n=1 Tax=Pontimicrobium sp. IMCC45349 TaxID=3391574 RepID=UPI0039A3CA72